MTAGLFLLYEWHFDSPVAPVWALIARTQDRADWWPSVKRVEQLDAGHAGGLGAVHEMRWKVLPLLTLRLEAETTKAEQNKCLESQSHGKYDIVESWHFFPQLHGTWVRHSWYIGFTEPWMDILPRVQPMLVRRYSRIMAEGLDAARRRLNERISA